MIQLKLDPKQYEELLDIIDIFEDCYVGNEEVTCFKEINIMIIEKVDFELIESGTREKICRQLKESLDWLASFKIVSTIIDKLLTEFGDQLSD